MPDQQAQPPSADELSCAFNAAIKTSGDERVRFFEKLRLQSPDLANEVASLLFYHSNQSIEGEGFDAPTRTTDGSILDHSPLAEVGSGISSRLEPLLKPGTLLCEDHGNGIHADKQDWSFRIEHEIGRGGMGVVYQALQRFPSRRVALKVLRSTATTQAARRLAHEAEALGSLQHRGIARVISAGTLRDCTPSSRGDSYLVIVMELIQGPALNQWAHGRSLREKIAVVAELADAVEHAHQRGVVHRDLKPGNVLIEQLTQPAGNSAPAAAPQPKVLDFGVARIISPIPDLRPPGESQTLSIGAGSVIGTLRYMSPEQARADSTGSVDARSDIYALGAVLYDLVTGTPPIPVDDTTIAGAVHRIATVRPSPCPHLRQGLSRRAAADLQTVIDKTLEKDPLHRYQHASDFANDLRRVLSDEPISARPPSAGEQIARLVRHNQVAATALLVGLLLLLTGTGLATWQAIRATHAAQRAQDEANVAASAVHFMQRMIAASTPEEARGQNVTVQEMLRTAVAEVKAMPEDKATALACRFLAESLIEIGHPAEAEPLAERALRISERVNGADSPESVHATCTLLKIHVLHERDRAGAIKRSRELRDRTLARLGPDDPLTLRTNIALSYALRASDKGESSEAEVILRDALHRMRRVMPENDPRTLAVMNDLSAHLLTAGRPDEALRITRDLYTLRRSTIGKEHPDTLVTMGNLTAIEMSLGNIERATTLNTEALELTTRVFGPDHPTTLNSKQYAVQLMLRSGKLAEAESAAKTLLDARTSRLGPLARTTMLSRGLYITCILMQGRAKDAEPLVRDLIDESVAAFGSADDDTIAAITLLFDLEEQMGNLAGMENAAAMLKGSKYEDAVNEQLKAARKKLIGQESQ